MFNRIKEFFFGKPVVRSDLKIEEAVDKTVLSVPDSQSVITSVPDAAFDVAPQPIVETKLDPVAVALDLEPMDFTEAAPVAVKKPRKPRTLKVVAKTKAEKAPTKKPAVTKSKKTK
jgi:hypothetical protein